MGSRARSATLREERRYPNLHPSARIVIEPRSCPVHGRCLCGVVVGVSRLVIVLPSPFVFWRRAKDAPEAVARLFVREEARALGLTIEQIESWTPPKKTRSAKPRKKTARKKKTETEVKPA